MSFKATEWEFSNEVDCTQIDPEPGPQYGQIIGAKYDADKATYSLTIQSCKNNAIFNLTYWLFQKDEGGATIPNSASRGTLISLGRALAGVDIGIPFPDDVKGGVVGFNLQMSKPSPTKGISYPRVYSFDPVPEDIAVMATIDQYYLAN
jgi:hypothetical protein